MSRDDDRMAILNQLGRFARMLDARSWDAIGEVFADDVAFDYGEGGEQAGIAALRLQFSRYLDNCGPSQHLLGSTMFAFEGDAAVTRSYVQARHQGKGARAHLFLDTNGEYIDRWVTRDGRWLVVRRDATWAIHMGDFSVLMPPEAS